MEKKIRNIKIVNFIGLLFVYIAIFALTFNFFSEKVDNVLEEKKEQDFFDDSNVTNDLDIAVGNANVENKVDSSNFIGILEIPKINLKRGFYDKNSKYNNVDKNIQVLKSSNYPDEPGNLILASHSGNSNISYFKNLYKLSTNDYIYIYYNKIKYTYKIETIYTEEKTGNISLKNENITNAITLITCTKNSETKQTIYIGSLVSKSSY